MPKNTNKEWTTTDKNNLRKMANSETTTKTIARKLGRSVGAVYNQASKQNTSVMPKDK